MRAEGRFLRPPNGLPSAVVFYKYEYECEICAHRWLSTHMVLEPASCPKCGNKDAEKVNWRELHPHEKRHAPTTEKGKRGRL